MILRFLALVNRWMEVLVTGIRTWEFCVCVAGGGGIMRSSIDIMRYSSGGASEISKWRCQLSSCKFQAWSPEENFGL